MKLVIHAHTLKNEPMSQVITARFDERGGTIGRSDTNTLTLPDPERHVSRLQAEVVFAARGFSIRNVGSANPIVLNGQAVGPGDGGALGDGDELVIGGYALHVALDGAAAGSQTGLTTRPGVHGIDDTNIGLQPRPAGPAAHSGGAGVAVGSAGRPATVDPFAGLMAGESAHASSDPFADLMGPGSSPPAAPQATQQATPRRSAAPPPADAPVARLPDDFDPFEDLAPAPPRRANDAALADFMSDAPAAPPHSLSAPAAPLDELPGGAAPSLDALFGLGGSGPAGADALAQFLRPASNPTDVGVGDPLAMLNPPAAAPGAIRGSAFDHTPGLAAGYVPPSVRAPQATPPRAAPVREMPRQAPPSAARAAPTPARPATEPRPSAATPEALWQAFCEGAGISLALPQGLNPELMRVIGQLMHHAVEGTLKLTALRTAAKQELRAQVTTIRAANNNPLKFAADPSAALAQLLQPPMRGFMMAPEAMRDVMDDLLGHHIGTMTGTRAALKGMLRRFEPARVEAKLAGNAVIDALLPMNRRARLWELYVQHYERIQDDAHEDFHELFGRAFVKAYEEQLERLDAARRRPG